MSEKTAAPERHTNNMLGAGFMVLAVFMYTLEAAVAKSLVGSGAVSIFILLAVRGLSQLFLPLPWLFRSGFGNVFKTPMRRLHLARGCLTVVSFSSVYYAVGNLPLTLSTVLSFSSVLWVVILAGPLLKERVGPARWISALVGFSGIVVAVRPSLEVTFWPIMSGLLGALAVALIGLTVRRLTASEPSERIMFYSGMCMSSAFVPLAAAFWEPIPLEHAWKVLLIVFCGPLGQIFHFNAYKVAEASAVAPVFYVRYLQAMAIGWLIFGELPDGWDIGGASLVVGAAIWITWYENRRMRRHLARGAAVSK